MMATRKTYIDEEGKRIKKPLGNTYVYTKTAKDINAIDDSDNRRLFVLVKDNEEVFSVDIAKDSKIIFTGFYKTLFEILKSRMFSKAAKREPQCDETAMFTLSNREMIDPYCFPDNTPFVCISSVNGKIISFMDNIFTLETYRNRTRELSPIRCHFTHLPRSKYKSAARYTNQLNKFIEV